MMRWLTWDCTFDVARAELSTRWSAASWVAKRLERQGVRGDQAAAEAVMMAELVACSEHWGDVVDAIANDPSPASALLTTGVDRSGPSSKPNAPGPPHPER